MNKTNGVDMIKTELEKPRTNTAVISARADVRHLGTIMDYLSKRGVAVSSRADLVYKAIELAALLVSHADNIHRFESTVQAERFLTKHGIKGLNSRGHGQATKLEQIIQEQEVEDVLDRLEGWGGSAKVDDEKVQKGMDALQQVMEGADEETEHRETGTGTD